jgi:hypothetical protein
LLRLLLAMSARALEDLARRTVLLGESDLREALAGLGLRSGGYDQPCIAMSLIWISASSSTKGKTLEITYSAMNRCNKDQVKGRMPISK